MVRLTTRFLTLAALVFTVLASPSPAPVFLVHEARPEPASGFVSAGAAPADKQITLRIAMKNSNIAGLEERVYAVSDPASPEYGQHLTPEEVAEFAKPAPETLAAVTAWLDSHSITATPVSHAGDIVSITVPVSKANELLRTTFEVFTHESGQQSIRTLQYSLPAELQGHIDNLHPTVSFARAISAPKFKVAKADRPEPFTGPVSDAVPSSCGTTNTPACLQAFYNIPTTKATQTSNKLGVSGFIDQFAQSADLKSFLTRLRTDIPSTTTFTLQTLDGGTNPQGANQAGIEANLDIQYTIGVATNVPVTFISVGANTKDGDLSGFLDIINQLIGEATGTRPNVLTTSYGFNEPDLTRSEATTLCNAYMQLTALGTSILFASGDGGVSGSQSQSCTTFIPTAPSGCPFLTSVGSTGGVTERASTFSSGGFSNYFAIPSYQANAVATYLTALGSTNSGKFNRTGRGFPDVATQGENFEIADGGQLGTVDGTSCASPTFASIIALLNDQLVAAGKPVLGFLNPFLYSAAGSAAFNDITTGNNPGCNTNGFPAKTGWDPVTGLGTPNFAKLKTAVGL